MEMGLSYELGATACIGFYNPSNIVHIILDNFLRSTVVKIQFQNIDLCNIARSQI